jgi:hypothetical protein
MLLLASCNKKSGSLPDMKERYGLDDTRPFGGYTAYRMLENAYPAKFINFNRKPFSKFYESTHFDSASLYINISNKFYLSEADAQSVIDFVYEGHTAFISASVIDSVLLNKIFGRQENADWLAVLNGNRYKQTSVKLLPGVYEQAPDSFSYYYLPFVNYFSQVHSDRGRITGYNQNNNPNFIVFFWGKGRLYLHCEPRAFGNYFLLSGNNYLYLEQIFEMLNADPGNIFWDDYYNKINYKEQEGQSFSTFSAVMKNPALAMAFWIGLAMLLLYILFGMKRKQRVVPVIEPVQNTSVAFTEAVAALYLAEKDNKNIADKMIAYFNDHVRTHYFLNAHAGNSDFIHSLSKKSAVPLESVQALYNAIEKINAAAEVSDFELLSLSEQIQLFYKKPN